MAAVWCIAALLCMLINIQSPHWAAKTLAIITGLLGIVYFIASIVGPRCERKDIDDDDGTKLDGGEEDEQGPDDAGFR
jgi:hypothetical protein